MKSAHVLFVIMICALFYSCESLIETLFGKNEELTFVRTNYEGNQLRTDGYYYNWLGKPHNNESIVKIIFLYRNGILLEGGNPYFRELEIFEVDYKSGQFNKSANKYRSF